MSHITSVLVSQIPSFWKSSNTQKTLVSIPFRRFDDSPTLPTPKRTYILPDQWTSNTIISTTIPTNEIIPKFSIPVILFPSSKGEVVPTKESRNILSLHTTLKIMDMRTLLRIDTSINTSCLRNISMLIYIHTCLTLCLPTRTLSATTIRGSVPTPATLVESIPRTSFSLCIDTSYRSIAYTIRT